MSFACWAVGKELFWACPDALSGLGCRGYAFLVAWWRVRAHLASLAHVDCFGLRGPRDSWRDGREGDAVGVAGVRL